MIKNYQSIQDSNVSGRIAVQLHEETKVSDPEKIQKEETESNVEENQEQDNSEQIDQTEPLKKQE